MYVIVFDREFTEDGLDGCDVVDRSRHGGANVGKNNGWEVAVDHQ